MEASFFDDGDEGVTYIDDSIDSSTYFSEESEDERGSSWMRQKAARQQKQLGVIDVPRFVINLDLPPEERWSEIAFRYKHDLQVPSVLICFG